MGRWTDMGNFTIRMEVLHTKVTGLTVNLMDKVESIMTIRMRVIKMKGSTILTLIQSARGGKLMKEDF